MNEQKDRTYRHPPETFSDWLTLFTCFAMVIVTFMVESFVSFFIVVFSLMIFVSGVVALTKAIGIVIIPVTLFFIVVWVICKIME